MGWESVDINDTISVNTMETSIRYEILKNIPVDTEVRVIGRPRTEKYRKISIVGDLMKVKTSDGKVKLISLPLLSCDAIDVIILMRK